MPHNSSSTLVVLGSDKKFINNITERTPNAHKYLLSFQMRVSMDSLWHAVFMHILWGCSQLFSSADVASNNRFVNIKNLEIFLAELNIWRCILVGYLCRSWNERKGWNMRSTILSLDVFGATVLHHRCMRRLRGFTINLVGTGISAWFWWLWMSGRNLKAKRRKATHNNSLLFFLTHKVEWKVTIPSLSHSSVLFFACKNQAAAWLWSKGLGAVFHFLFLLCPAKKS